MNQSFREHVDRLPDLMDALTSSPMHDWHNLRGIPSDGAGIYVFYENGLPIYVGRTRKMRQRIRSHGYKGSRNNSASFAFNLAKKNAETRGVDVTRSRSELDENPAFKSLFDAERERERVRRMSVQVIKIDDPVTQTLFEVYAVLELDTQEFNDFGTH